MNLQLTCISYWHRVSILISIVAKSVIKSGGTMARMSGATVNSSPVNPTTTVPHRGNGEPASMPMPHSQLKAANHVKTLLQPVNAHSHTIALNHTLTENSGCIAKMISGKAGYGFWPPLPLAWTLYGSLGHTLAIVVLECQMLYAKYSYINTEHLTFLVHFMQSDSYTGKALFILLWTDKDLMTEDFYVLQHDLCICS